MIEGWVCPVCGHVWAPWVTNCTWDHLTGATSTNIVIKQPQVTRSCCGADPGEVTGCCQ